ncbi:zinc finger protein 782 [Elysia marginata]|uniref:Zinc finger protein 782 n=1 Tax=Elysia marginata TaxID=1093978 RepID=A0AAV4H574_9GAST|nr:zinc finger protein 782 [Elysia marginata]
MPKTKTCFRCDHCDKVFTRTSQYEKNGDSVKEEKPQVCEICDKQLTSIQGQKARNIKTRKGEKPYKCNQCDKCFSSSTGLSYHKLTHSGERPFACDTCGQRFRHKAHLQNHAVKHVGVRSHQCEICGLAFYTQKDMRSHQKVHMDEDKKVSLKERLSLPCEVCGKIYRSQLGLNTHLKQHAGEKPYTCKICGKAYTNSAALLYHQKLHSGEKSYTCDACGRAFSSHGGLEIHKRTHTGEKPFRCDVCQLCFGSRSNLHAHQRTHTRAWLAAQHQVVPKPVSASALKMRKYREKLKADPSLAPPSLQVKPKSRPKKVETLKKYKEKLKALDKLRTLPMKPELDSEHLVHSVLKLNGYSVTDDNVEAASQQILQLLPHNVVVVSSQQEQYPLTASSATISVAEAPSLSISQETQRPESAEWKKHDLSRNHLRAGGGEHWKEDLKLSVSSVSNLNLANLRQGESSLKLGSAQFRFLPEAQQQQSVANTPELNYITYEMLIENPDPILRDGHCELSVHQVEPSPHSVGHDLMPVDPNSIIMETQTGPVYRTVEFSLPMDMSGITRHSTADLIN